MDPFPGFVVSTGLLLSEPPKRMFEIPVGRPLKPGTAAMFPVSVSSFIVFSPAGSFDFVSASSRFFASSSRVRLAKSSLSFDSEMIIYGNFSFF